jgi:hypothetical protein
VRNISSRIANSWRLMKSCLLFLSKNKDLMILPILSLITVSFFLALLFGGGIYEIVIHNFNQQSIVVASIISLIAYFILSFIVIFFNATLIACAISRLQGKHVSIRGGFSMAGQHFPQLLGWCLISCVVGLIIKILENSHNVIEKIIAATIGFSWALCSYFVLPILVVENIGPLAAIKQSGQKFKQNWRKVISINLIFFLFFLAVAAIIYGLTVGLAVLPIPSDKEIVVMAVVAYLILMIFGTTLGSIANSALYLYIMKKTDTPYFANALLDQAIVPRRKNKNFKL